MRTCMVFASLNGKGDEIVEAFKGSYNLQELESRAKNLGLTYEIERSANTGISNESYTVAKFHRKSELEATPMLWF